jgi:Family of unknown function (DUF7033)
MLEVGASPIASTGPVHAHRGPSGVPRLLTREARAYAMKELARRAGVSHEFFRTWRMELSEEGTTIYVLPGSRKRVFFPDAPRGIWPELIGGEFRTVRLGWLNESAVPSIQDAVIPFVHQSQAQSRALFRTIDSESVECTVDLPLAALLILSRWEERLIEEKDQHGRVPATACVAYRERFLRRPVVDEYGLAFRQALQWLMPNWKPLPSQLRVNVSHDVDSIGLPFNIRTSVGHTLRRRNPAATANDFLGLLPGFNPTLLETIRTLVTLCLRRGLGTAVYWKGTTWRGKTKNYDPYHPKVRAMVEWLRKYEIEMGVHPGYETFRSPDKLRREVQTVREITGVQTLGGRQDYLRWCPHSWLDWENCGLVYDTTVGFADQVGFRAGTCFPYFPWLFELNRQAKLVESPLIVMDCTLTSYMKLDRDQSLIAVSECIEQCRKVGGVFALLWHAESMLNPALENILTPILDSLQGLQKCDLTNPPNLY